MDKDFQDKIDEYVLGRMSSEERQEFEKEIFLDDEKREQLRFTQNVKSAIDSRQEKLRRMEEMRRRHSISAATGTDGCRPDMRTFAPAPRKKPSLKRIWLWVSGIAAVLVVGYFVIGPFRYESPLQDDVIPYGSPSFRGRPSGTMRGDEKDIFDDDIQIPKDVEKNDTIGGDTTIVK